jgi:galactokinase
MDIQKLREEFLNIFGENESSIRFVKAPGRINLIGEHTDYNDGFVLPVAIDRFIFMAGRQRDDKKLIIYAEDKNRKVETNCDEIFPKKDIKWANYSLGVYYFLKKEKYKLKGAEILLKGEIPIGKGLSSSAALEVSTCYLLSLLFNLRIEPVKMAKLCQKAENEFVGMPCGIMDQFISILGKEGNALFLDCRDLSYDYIPIGADDINIMVTDSGVKRELTSSPYKKRRNECYTAVELLKKFMPQLNSLRDLSIEQFKKYEDILPDVLRKRVKHVIFEDERVNKSAQFLKKGQLQEFGKLMYESHASLKNDYEVSCKELDILIEIAKICKGVIGSRMTGAGFGGSTVTLVEKDKSEEVKHITKQQYFKKTGINPDIYICDIVDGVEEMA